MIWLKIISNLRARIVFLGKKNVTDFHKFLFGAELCVVFFFPSFFALFFYFMQSAC